MNTKAKFTLQKLCINKKHIHNKDRIKKLSLLIFLGETQFLIPFSLSHGYNRKVSV